MENFGDNILKLTLEDVIEDKSPLEHSMPHIFWEKQHFKTNAVLLSPYSLGGILCDKSFLDYYRLKTVEEEKDFVSDVSELAREYGTRLLGKTETQLFIENSGDYKGMLSKLFDPYVMRGWRTNPETIVILNRKAAVYTQGKPKNKVFNGISKISQDFAPLIKDSYLEVQNIMVEEGIEQAQDAYEQKIEKIKTSCNIKDFVNSAIVGRDYSSKKGKGVVELRKDGYEVIKKSGISTDKKLISTFVWLDGKHPEFVSEKAFIGKQNAVLDFDPQRNEYICLGRLDREAYAVTLKERLNTFSRVLSL